MGQYSISDLLSDTVVGAILSSLFFMIARRTEAEVAEGVVQVQDDLAARCSHSDASISYS